MLAILVSCQSAPEPVVFDADHAYSLVADQVAIGERYTGSTGHQEIQTLISDTLEENAWNVEFQPFDYYGIEGANIIATRQDNVSPEEDWIILAAHYDTRMLADQDPNLSMRSQPVMGANDGASGVAVLLELSRILPELENKNVWLVFFDGEDNGNIEGRDWIQGSRHFVDQLNVMPDQVVIIDMIGDVDQNIYLEKNSNPELSAVLWETASRLGIETFIAEEKYSMLDDHTPFLAKGISAVDIIDFDYPYWHTTEDTLDKVSAESLGNVGNVLLTWLVGEG
ncbi:M28 family peptidase [bacterium]|nr:M28 family peptidase [bacterium]